MRSVQADRSKVPNSDVRARIILRKVPNLRDVSFREIRFRLVNREVGQLRGALRGRKEAEVSRS